MINEDNNQQIDDAEYSLTNEETGETAVEMVPAESKMATILLVEDNEEFRFHLKDSLQPFYHIIEAANGKEGWQKHFPDTQN